LRHRILEPLRLYGQDRLADRNETERVRRAHAAYYLELAGRARPHLLGPDEAAWIERLRAEDANLRSALDWSTEHEREIAYQLATALWRYWSNSLQHHATVP